MREPVAGLTRARNLGARAARGELVAYIDDDAIAEPSWLDGMVREFHDPSVAAVGGRTRYMVADPATLQMTDQEADGEVAPRTHRRFHRTQSDWFAQACFGGIGDGNTMMFRRALLVSAVRFDERVGRGRPINSGDEHVAFMSLLADGHTVVRTPAAVVRHPVVVAPGARRDKRMRDLRSSVAYTLFLFAECPRHRLDIVRHFSRRGPMAASRVTGRASDGLSVVAVACTNTGGALDYFRALRQSSAPATTDAPVPRVVSLR